MFFLPFIVYCPEVCPQQYEPVCGTDGQTYANRCQLGFEACNYDDTLRAAYAGECVKVAPTGRDYYE